MALTPNTSSTAFCTPAQLLDFYDENLLGQLADDTGNPVSPTGLLNNAKVAAALSAAAGDIEAACSVAGRYLPSDLQALIAAGGNGALRLARLNADLAFASLRERRGYRSEADFPQIARAFLFIERLRLGERIFAFVEVEQAGVGSMQDQGATALRTKPLATTVARRYFGRRGRCYPAGNGCC